MPASIVGQLRQTIASFLATSFALLGETAASEAWLEEARRRHKHDHLRMEAMPEGILRARQGRFEEAVSVLRSSWRALEGSVTGDLIRLLRLVLAYALARTGAPDDDVKAQVAGAGPLTLDEARMLTAAWPELQAFLVERGVA